MTFDELFMRQQELLSRILTSKDDPLITLDIKHFLDIISVIIELHVEFLHDDEYRRKKFTGRCKKLCTMRDLLIEHRSKKYDSSPSNS